MGEQRPIFLTPEEAAAELRVSTKTLDKWITDGLVPVVVFTPRIRRIPREAIEALAAREARVFEAEPLA